jgi:hypothetical protein
MIIAKALVPLFVAPIVFLLESVGITPDMTIEQAITFIITMAVTAVTVYAVPNRK